MLPLTFQAGSGNPTRLHATHARGHPSGFSPQGGLIFGFVFVSVGVWITLVGLRLIEPGGHFTIPREFLVPIGAVFAGIGFFIWMQTWRRRSAEVRHQRLRTLHPDEPALADYAWNPSGSPSRLRAHAVRATIIAGFFILLLTPGNYIAFAKTDAPLLVQIGIIVFDLVTIYLLYDAALRWGRAIKFGQSFLRFDTFPFSTRTPVKLAWIAPEGCKGDATGTFTLRAVREWYEAGGRGKSDSTRLVHEQQWAATWKITTPSRIVPGAVCELVFDLPPGAPSTSFHAERPLFWELVVDLHLPGVDFQETYLVPIYGPKRT